VRPGAVPWCSSAGSATTSRGGRNHSRIPYEVALGAEDEFWTLTHRALSVGRSVEEPHRSVLALLIDCGAVDHGRRADKQARGASYKQLALINHRVGMTKAKRQRWYEIPRRIPLSEAHAVHLITSLSRSEAA
jgi:hypothetical protein